MSGHDAPDAIADMERRLSECAARALYLAFHGAPRWAINKIAVEARILARDIRRAKRARGRA